MSVKIVPSPVFFVDNTGEAYNFSGISYREAAVASPLVEDGSGQGLGHPETKRKICVQTTVSTTVAAFKFDYDKVEETLVIAPRKTKLKYGDPVISMKSKVARNGLVVLEKWTSLHDGKVISEPELKYSSITNMLTVKIDCLEIVETDAEKFRGFGKFRSNGGFLRNIEIVTNGGDLIFNPSKDLKDENGNLLQVEHVVGGEEYKTLNYVIGLLADQMTDGQAAWFEETGEWDNKQELEALVQDSMIRVSVRRWGYEESAYAMLKAMYGNHPDFVFDDSLNQVIHNNVMAWVGNQVQIVEVPLTRTFVGKCPLFGEHIATLGMEFPELYKVLINEVKVNQKRIKQALDLGEGIIPGATDNNPYGKCVVIDSMTEVVDAEKSTLVMTPQEDGSVMVDSIKVAGDYDLALLSKFQKLLEKNGFAGIVIEAQSDNTDDVSIFALNLDVFRSLTGSASHKLVRTLFQLFSHLEIPLDERDINNWTGEFYRLARILQGGLEFAVADSSSLMAKATKTTAIAFGCRAGSTLDATVGMEEIHLHPEFAAYWGVEEGDLVIPGRVPVPGMGVLTLVLNERVPFGTCVMNAAMKHAIEEGDVDGDQALMLIFSPEGELRRPGSNIPEVSGIAKA